MIRTSPWTIGPPGPKGPIERIEPTPEEAANGWTVDTLSAYVAERRAAEDARIDPRSRRKPRPQSANSTLAKSRWARTPRWTIGQSRWGPGRN